MRVAKGYNEWINADIGCCLVKFQFQFIVNAMTSKQYNLHFVSCSRELDRIYAYYNNLWPIFILCENLNVLQNVYRHQKELFDNLVRLRNIVM